MPTTTYHNTRDPSRTLWCPQIHRKYTFLSLTLHHHLRCVERKILVSKTFLLETLTHLNHNLTQHLWPLSHTLLPSNPSEIHCFSHAGHNPLQKEHNQIWCWWSCALTRTCQSATEEANVAFNMPSRSSMLQLSALSRKIRILFIISFLLNIRQSWEHLPILSHWMNGNEQGKDLSPLIFFSFRLILS